MASAEAKEDQPEVSLQTSDLKAACHQQVADSSAETAEEEVANRAAEDRTHSCHLQGASGQAVLVQEADWPARMAYLQTPAPGTPRCHRSLRAAEALR